MKKISTALYLFCSLFLFLSCSSKDSEYTILKPSTIKPDIFIPIGITHDMAVFNNEIYFMELATEFSDAGVQSNPIYIKKLENNGTLSVINDFLPFRSFTSTQNGRFTITSDGKPVSISNHSNKGNTIYSIKENAMELKETVATNTIQDNISVFNDITSLNDDFIIYDKTSATLRGFNLDIQETDFLVGNPDMKEVKDGVGTNAGFSNVSKIITAGNILYAVDNKNYLREITNTDSGFKVKTLIDISDKGNITDIAYDSNSKEILISIQDYEYNSQHKAGLYSYNVISDSLVLLYSGVVSLDVSELDTPYKETSGFDFWGKINHMQVIGNDLYFEQLDIIIKISDFRSFTQN